MKGAGFLIWQLQTIAALYTPEQLAKLLTQARIDWVSWKIADGILPFNQVGGNDKALISYMQALEAAGIVNGGWAYSYGKLPGPEGARISERIEKFQGNLDTFDHVMLDIEVEWKGKSGKTVDLLLASIDVNKNYSIGFCSYRYPKYHPEINYDRFLKSEKIKMINPQVYWMGAHNPGDQLERSLAEYKAITDKAFLPMGAAWGETVGGKYWEVSQQDLEEFVAKCKALKCEAYGFYSLDWVLSHNKFSWLEAIGGGHVEMPGPEVKPMPGFVTVNTAKANIRNAPEVNVNTDVGDTPKGSKFRVLGEVGDFWRVEAFIAKSVVDAK